MMTKPVRLRIAVQKSGRLNNDSMDLLFRCGLKISPRKNSLLCHGENLPLDILFVRDDDIPTLVKDGVCDLGIIGQNVLFEKSLGTMKIPPNSFYEIVKSLGFSRCRLSIAVPTDKVFNEISALNGCRIATSYPNLLGQYLVNNNIDAQILIISGSVEIAPSLGMTDAICDLVSTGRTLEENNLRELVTVMQSEAVLIKAKDGFSEEKAEIFDLLTRRVEGVLKALESKYIMFHAPKSQLEAIKKILPGCETPTILTLEGCADRVAVHVVAAEGVFWTTLEKLKKAGASSILVLPIEKMMN